MYFDLREGPIRIMEKKMHNRKLYHMFAAQGIMIRVNK